MSGFWKKAENINCFHVDRKLNSTIVATELFIQNINIPVHTVEKAQRSESKFSIIFCISQYKNVASS